MELFSSGCNRLMTFIVFCPVTTRNGQTITPRGFELHQHLEFAGLIWLHADNWGVGIQIGSLSLWSNDLGGIIGIKSHTGMFSW